MGKKTVLNVTLSKLIGLSIFLLLLYILNSVRLSSAPRMIVHFLNEYLLFIIIFSVFFYLGELFFLFVFPLNIPAPLFYSVGGVLLTGFIFQIIYVIGEAVDANFLIFRLFEPIAFFLVFVLVIIVGYFNIFIKLIPKKDKPTKQKKTKKSKKNDIDWKDIGGEFKMALYNLASTMKDALEPKK